MLLATDIKDPHAVGNQRRVWKVSLLIFPMHHNRQTHTLGSIALVAAVVLEGGGVVSGCPRGGGGVEIERRVGPQRNWGGGGGGTVSPQYPSTIINTG